MKPYGFEPKKRERTLFEFNLTIKLFTKNR